MNKPQLLEILQACLLSFEGCPDEVVYESKEPKNAKVGINLCKKKKVSKVYFYTLETVNKSILVLIYFLVIKVFL